MITAEGIKAQVKRKNRKHRVKEGFGINRTAWGHRALAAYTWCRTNRGPQRSWLYHVGKKPDNLCPECGVEETGDHIVFQCRTHQEGGKLGTAAAWADLDKPIWVGEGKDRYDAVQDFSYTVTISLTRGIRCLASSFIVHSSQFAFCFRRRVFI